MRVGTVEDRLTIGRFEGLDIAFSFAGIITTQNKRTKHLFKEGVAHLVDNQNQRSPEDFITVADAQQQILLQTGRTVSHSTAARWIAQNNLGYKLLGFKGQCIVNGVLFKDFLREVKT